MWQYNKTIKKKINFDDVIKENIKEHNANWPQIADHPYIILIIGGSWSGKINSLFDLITQRTDIGKIYLYSKLLISKRESTGLKHFNDSKACI